MWIIIKFYNIILKSANLDEGGGAKALIHKMWIKTRVFLTPPVERKVFFVVPNIL